VVSNSEDAIDRLLLGVVTRVPGWAVVFMCLVFYPGIGLGLPLALNWSIANLIAANFAGVTLAAIIVVGWLLVRVEARDRRHLIEWTTNIRLLNSEEFEWVVGEVFRREGWKVRETGRQDGPDGNIDLELTKGSDRRIVQCKRWQSWEVGIDQVRAFAGTLLREKLAGKQGMYVTLSNFTTQARDEAKKTGITIIDGQGLYARVERSRRTEPCPDCGNAMVLDRSHRGWWLRCVAGNCSGKRDLGNEPGRAVELLTQPPALGDVHFS
jgi:restriction system protein